MAKFKRMAKLQVNGQILDFYKTANGHGHSPNCENSNRRMAMAIHQKVKVRIGEWPYYQNVP